DPWTRRTNGSGPHGHRRPLERGIHPPGDRRSAGRGAGRVQANPRRHTERPARSRRRRQRRRVLDPVPRSGRGAALVLQGRTGGARSGPENDHAGFSRASRAGRARRPRGVSRIAGRNAMKAALAILFALLITAELQGQLTYDRVRQAAREPGSWLTYHGTY